jgi:C-terminal processing protease CtpA/Prc
MAMRRLILCVFCVVAALVLTPFQSAAQSTGLATQEPAVLGFEKGAEGQVPRPWFLGPGLRGWWAELVKGNAPAGERFLMISKSAESTPMGNVMRTVPIADYAGKRVRLRAQLRVKGDGRAQMWLRVDRQGKWSGAFDNMSDRPIRGDEWQRAEIEVDVARDAANIALGFLAYGATVSIDDVTFAIVGDATAPGGGPSGPLTERELRNAVAASRLLGYLWFFHPSDALVELPREQWGRFAAYLLDTALPAADDTELATRLGAITASMAPTVQIWSGDAAQAPDALAIPEGATQRRYWEHHGAGRIATDRGYYSRVITKRIERPVPARDEAMATHVVTLVEGVHARVPVLVWGLEDQTLPPSKVPPEWSKRSQVSLELEQRTTRLAAVAQAWNVCQHFYPYFDVVDVDWSAELPRALDAMARADSPTAASEVLERLVAALDDGHGSVWGVKPPPSSFLPVAVRWAGADLVVTGLGRGAKGVQIGDIVEAIDGQPVADVYAAMRKRISAATDGWARYSSQSMLRMWPTKNPVTLRIRRTGGEVTDIELPRAAAVVKDTTEQRPDDGAEVADGIVYFDLDAADTPQLEEHLDSLRRASGIIFDMRGYPSSAAYELMEMLMTEPGRSAIFEAPIVTWPDRQKWQWDDKGRWHLKPKEPHLAAEVAFLTDGRAISYAESIMGIVEAYRLGEIVGETTAGTNGDINPFEVAGGFHISWTDLRVRKHDGSPHHGVGIAPTVPVITTAEGIAAGRDEVLERAIEVLQTRLHATHVPKQGSSSASGTAQ